jgi:hypothetical protein
MQVSSYCRMLQTELAVKNAREDLVTLLHFYVIILQQVQIYSSAQAAQRKPSENLMYRSGVPVTPLILHLEEQFRIHSVAEAPQQKLIDN